MSLYKKKAYWANIITLTRVTLYFYPLINKIFYIQIELYLYDKEVQKVAVPISLQHSLYKINFNNNDAEWIYCVCIKVLS